MNSGTALFIGLLLALPAAAQIKPPERKSLLDRDPEVVYLEHVLEKPIILTVVKEAPVFLDKSAKRRLGILKTNQKVQLEGMTERAYRVRGEGTRGRLVGWVAPWAFSSEDPNFVENLKKFYQRQMAVQAVIDAKEVAIGMTVAEVSESLGKPTKTTVRRTSTGQTGQWEYVEYDEVKHYINRIDPSSGAVYRQLSHVTQEEKSKTVVEFENDVVSAIEESVDRKGGNLRIVVPPVVFGW